MTELESKQIDDKLKTLIVHYSEDELEKRFFKDFGCINCRTDEYYDELELARAFHKYHQQLWPAKHEVKEVTPYSCYHQTICKCGFSEAYDSSD